MKVSIPSFLRVAIPNREITFRLVMANDDRMLRVFSGIQPSGGLHLGNYIGAVTQWVTNQELYDCIYCIVDFHALTALGQKPLISRGAIAKRVWETAALLLACGLDPEHSVIFAQSDVPAHVELAWILGCLTPVSWLERMTQYKARGVSRKNANAGLLNYPVLQAADILLYRADLVPVGEDQEQHIELAVDIVQRFNRAFGEVFTVPRPQMRTTGSRIMGLDDPSVKMSKSLAEMRANHAICLADPPDVIRRVIFEAVTDSVAETTFESASAGVRNLMTIFEALSGNTRAAIESHFAGKGYRYLKEEVAELVITVLEPIRNRYQELVRDPAYIENILLSGARRVSPIADATLEDVKSRVGIKRDAAHK